MIKPQKIRAYRRPLKMHISGATAPDGTPYIRVKVSDKFAWIPRESFSGSGSSALSILKRAGIPLLSNEWAQCRNLVADLEAYPVKPLIDRPGWNGPHFAMLDGSVFSPPKCGRAVVLFPTNQQKCASAGSLKDWRRITADLKGQHLVTFVLMTAFAGPLLALSHQISNPGFELAGPGGKGKSTALRLAAAACGPTDSPVGINYWITANATMNGLEGALWEHNDMPLLIDETNLVAASEQFASRAAKFNDLAFKLSDGTEKRRFGSSPPRRSRFVFMTSTNEPLAQLLAGHRVAVAEAAADRYLTIPVDADRPHGIFDHLPDDRDGASLAEHFNSETRKTFGVGMRQFLQRLANERAMGPEAFDKRLRQLIARFRRKVGVDGNDGSEARVADSFGLVFAAGVLAVEFRAISKLVDPLAAATACYNLNRASRAKPLDPLAKLIELADIFDALWITYDQLPELSDKEVESYSSILRKGRDGRSLLLLTPAQLERAFPNRQMFFADPRIREVQVTEGGRKQTRCQIRSNRRKERFHCFRIPELDSIF